MKAQTLSVLVGPLALALACGMAHAQPIPNRQNTRNNGNALDHDLRVGSDGTNTRVRDLDAQIAGSGWVRAHAVTGSLNKEIMGTGQVIVGP